MALHPDTFPEFSVAALWMRLPLQGVLIAWALWYTRTSTSELGGHAPAVAGVQAVPPMAKQYREGM
jgi:hypothetical protein